MVETSKCCLTEIESRASHKGRRIFSFSEHEWYGSEMCHSPERSSNPKMKSFAVWGQWEESGPWELSLKYACVLSRPVTWMLMLSSHKTKNRKKNPNHRWNILQEGKTMHRETQEARFKEGLISLKLKSRKSHFSSPRVCYCHKWQIEVSGRFFLLTGKQPKIAMNSAGHLNDHQFNQFWKVLWNASLSPW